jgi:NAD(P)-dependent dehydrogenase (short-subunit alcohol dehydrogenase family)
MSARRAHAPARVVIQGASGGLGFALAESLLCRSGVERVVLTAREPFASQELLDLVSRYPRQARLVALDVTQEDSLAAASKLVEADLGQSVDLAICCAGLLHHPDGLAPEKRIETLSSENLEQVFRVNAFGPLLFAKHFWHLLAHGERAVWANVSARIGSIADNRAGGWYAYRASKAAQNMLTRTFAIEMARRAPQLICLALHPGTVATELSRPFRSRLSPEKVFSPEVAAEQLLRVIDRAEPDPRAQFKAWDGSEIPW